MAGPLRQLWPATDLSDAPGSAEPPFAISTCRLTKAEADKGTIELFSAARQTLI
jgi:hypothetical protein